MYCYQQDIPTNQPTNQPTLKSCQQTIRGSLCFFWILALMIVNWSSAVWAAPTIMLDPIQVTTLAGSSTSGSVDGIGTAAKFSDPSGVAVDTAGNLYVADGISIRKIVISTGAVTTLASSFVNGISVDTAGNLYVTDFYGNRIRKLVIATGVVTTLAGSTEGYANGTGTAAKFYNPYDVAVDTAGNLYVADTHNHSIRKLVIATGAVTTLAGSTQFSLPLGVAVDTAGNLYVADYDYDSIRKLVIATGVVTTLAGSSAGSADGAGPTAKFNKPHGVAVDTAGNLYVADYGNNRIRKIVIATGVVTTLAGSTQGFNDGTGTAARFYSPSDVAVDMAGNLYVADTANYRIRKMTPLVSTTFSTTVGNASAAQSFRVSGNSLTANLTVTAPTGYEVSLSSGTGYAASVNMTPTAGVVNSVLIYIRLAAITGVGTYNGNITLTSTGATTKTLAVTGTVALAQAQTISFIPPASGTVASTATLSATATSGLTVTFASTTTSICTVSGNTLSYVGAGTCTLTANQAGNTNYNAAPPVSGNLTVGQATQTISFTPPASGVVGSTATLSATTTSGLTVTFASTTTSICTVSGNIVSYISSGTCILTANQAGNTNYQAAPQVSKNLAAYVPTYLTGVSQLWAGNTTNTPSVVGSHSGIGNHSCVLTSSGGVKCWGYNLIGQLGDNTTTTTRYTPIDVSGLTSGVTAIATGDSHTCALTSSGGVKCWGYNGSGGLGDNTATSRYTPIDVTGLTGVTVTAIATGGFHTCALTSSGGVKCWGFGGFGQLGDNTTTDRYTPVDVSGLTNGVTAMATGYYHTCALTSSGGVKCWGYNDYGQLGDNTTIQRKIPVDVTGLTGVTVTAIATGGRHTCALTSSGGIKCWGKNNYGQLGDNTTTNHLTPMNVTGLTNGVIAIAAGYSHTCALTSSSGIKCWGYNLYGQLGDNTTTQRKTPVDVTGLTNGVTAIAAGYSHTCALLTGNGGVKCWGDNGYGQLGDTTTTQRKTPVEVLVNMASSVNLSLNPTGTPSWVVGETVTGNYTYNVDSEVESGTLFQWYQATDSSCSTGQTTLVEATAQTYTLASSDIGKYICFGVTPGNANGTGLEVLTTSGNTIKNNNQTISFTPPVSGMYGSSATLTATATSGLTVTFASTTTSICTVSGSIVSYVGMGTCTLTANQAGNANYQAALQVSGNLTTYSTYVPLTSVSQLWAGNTTNTPSVVGSHSGAGYHSCVLTSNGGVKCWGDNSFGELGDNTTTTRYTPVDVTGLTGVTVTAIAVGWYYTCALTSSGGVKCWGRNSSGTLGDNTTTTRYTPVDVSGLTSGVTAIATGNSHTCALTSSGGVKCWGDNYYGTLGDNTTTTHYTPVDVSGLTSGVTAIAAGYSYTCALTNSGGIKCWGRNGYGQLGDNTTTNRYTPVAVTGLTGVTVTAIATGFAHTCALTNSGEVKCWGFNNYGQLGDNTITSRHTPVNVTGLTGVTMIAIAASYYHTCALTNSGGVKCWGTNDYGQQGDNTTTQRNTPVDVTGLTSGVTAIATGYRHTCALTNSGGVKCWGYNGYGQLGDTTTTQRKTPVDVLVNNNNTPPTANTVSLSLNPTGTPSWVVGETVKGNYTYNDVDNDVESGTLFQWYQATNSSCSTGKTTLSGATTQTYTLASGDVGKYICFGVTPKNAQGMGTEVLTTSGNTIKGNQTITFSPPTSGSYGGSAPLSATATSNLTVTFASTTPDICTVDSITVNYIKIGTCNLTATQAGNANYNAAPQVSGNVTVGQATQTITYTGPTTATYDATPLALSAFGGGSSNDITFTSSTPSVCTTGGTNGATLTIVGAGTCTVTANQAGNVDYHAAATVTQNITINAKPVTPPLVTPRGNSATRNFYRYHSISPRPMESLSPNRWHRSGQSDDRYRSVLPLYRLSN